MTDGDILSSLSESEISSYLSILYAEKAKLKNDDPAKALIDKVIAKLN